MDELIARACALRDECEVGVKERGVMPDYVDACVALKGLAPKLLDALTTLQAREATLIRALREARYVLAGRWESVSIRNVMVGNIDEALATSDLAEGKSAE
jgi:hypothetical protein